MNDLSSHPELLAQAREAFDAALAGARSPYETGRSAEDQFIQEELDRLLCNPKLPNAGARERRWMARLDTYARDESLVVEIKAAAGRYARALEEVLPRREYIKRGDGWLTLPGCYYSCKRVTANTNKSLYRAAHDLKSSAGNDHGKRWLADFILDGCPEAVSNFKMECLYLVRDGSAEVRRLVRLVNTMGEVSKGREIGGADLLPNEMYAGAEKFRQWCLSRGNFNWGVGNGAGNLELQMLQNDMSNDAAYRVVQLIEYCGWHPFETKSEEDEAALSEIAEPQIVRLSGIWFYDDCAYVDGKCVLPDEDGIIWHDAQGYALAYKGREAQFIHGRPRMRPRVRIEDLAPKLDTSHWEEAARNGMKLALRNGNPDQMLGSFFQEVCRQFYDCAGGYEGWLVVGSILSYPAAPEIFELRKLFPGLFVSGQARGGKTTLLTWAMRLAGYGVDRGLALVGGNATAVGLMCQLENYSNLPVWLEEFRQGEVTPDKMAIIRDIYNRQLAAKWSPDGRQRVIRTAVLVSGESTPGDAATRSRYPQVVIAEQKRRAHLLATLPPDQQTSERVCALEARQIQWMHRHQKLFVLFWRRLMDRRAEFVELVLSQIDAWMEHRELGEAPNRERVTHAVAFAAFAAATVLLESHSADEVAAFRKFLMAQTHQAAADVAEDVNVNVFLQEVITAYKAGSIPNSCFKLESQAADHPPNAPGQGRWTSYVLFLSPDDVINHLQIHLKRSGASVTLRKNDLRNQLSKNEYWFEEKDGLGRVKRLQRRIGGARCDAWGIIADKHPLGYQMVSDEELARAGNQPTTLEDVGRVFGREGDPRKGPLFAIIEGVEREQNT